MGVLQGLTLTQVSQDVVANTSQVHILWQSTQTGGSYNGYEKTAKYYVSINGAEAVEYSVLYRLPSKTTVNIVDTEITVPHNAEGTCEITVNTWMNTGISAGTVELTQSLTLTPIPRATTLGATDANIGAVSMIALNRKSESYTHSVRFLFGETAGWLNAAGEIIETEEKLTALSIPFRIPEGFYDQIPDSPTGVCQLFCITYADETVVGTEQATEFTVTASQASCAPSVTGQVKDNNPVTVALTGNDAVMIRYISEALCEAAAEVKNGARLQLLTIDGVDENPHTITAFEQANVVFRAVDSRGYVAECSVQPQLVPYVRLTVNVSAKRTDPTSGNATLTVTGNFYNGSFGASENTLALKYRVGTGEYVSLQAELDGNTYQATAAITDLDYLSSHTIEVVAADLADAITGTASVGKGIPVFDWGEEDFVFHVPLSMDGKRIVKLATPESDMDAATKAYADQKAEKTHQHTAAAISEGVFNEARLPTISVNKGGTGATNATDALKALGGVRIESKSVYIGSNGSETLTFTGTVVAVVVTITKDEGYCMSGFWTQDTSGMTNKFYGNITSAVDTWLTTVEINDKQVTITRGGSIELSHYVTAFVV